MLIGTIRIVFTHLGIRIVPAGTNSFVFMLRRRCDQIELTSSFGADY